VASVTGSAGTVEEVVGVVHRKRLESKSAQTLDETPRIGFLEVAHGVMVELHEHLPERLQLIGGQTLEQGILGTLEIQLEDVRGPEAQTLDQRTQRERFHIITCRHVTNDVDVVREQRAALVGLTFMKGEPAVACCDRTGHVLETARVLRLEGPERVRMFSG